ncbi:MAG: hypothetical protein WB760_23555 [Xanthobacteraceae bacterium]
MTKKAGSILALAVLVMAWSIYLAVVPYQRKLILVAIDNMTFNDGADRTKVISFSKGASAEVIECRDAQSDLEPVIRLSDGRKAYPRDGRFRIDTQRTGLLSRPRYLGCPGY